MGPTLSELHSNVVQAGERYKSAKQAEDDARRNTTEALNNLNAAQRELDRTLAELKKASPLGSDWHPHATVPVR